MADLPLLMRIIQAPPPKYDKPRILLIDMDAESADTLHAAGFNTSTGTFGKCSRVQQSAQMQPVLTRSVKLPGLEEQEIIIVDTARPSETDNATLAPHATGVEGLWQSAAQGVIDPRPFAMYNARADFERIFEHGGIFIVLLSQQYEVTYNVGTLTTSGVRENGSFEFTNWSFLKDLVSFSTEERNGTEIRFTAPLLERGAHNARYTCVVRAHHPQIDRWEPLATNKYGEQVGGILRHSFSRGTILLGYRFQ